MAKRISTEDAKRFGVSRDQLQSFYDEFVKLSAKKPDGPINRFKLMHLNGVVTTANQLLGDSHVPFAEFTKFSEDEMPSNSDVVMILAQYLSQMDRFRVDHSFKTVGSLSHRTWLTEEYNEDGTPIANDEDDEEEDDLFEDDEDHDEDDDA